MRGRGSRRLVANGLAIELLFGTTVRRVHVEARHSLARVPRAGDGDDRALRGSVLGSNERRRAEHSPLEVLLQPGVGYVPDSIGERFSSAHARRPPENAQSREFQTGRPRLQPGLAAG